MYQSRHDAASTNQRVDSLEETIVGVKAQLDELAGSIGQLVTEAVNRSLEQLRNTVEKKTVWPSKQKLRRAVIR